MKKKMKITSQTEDLSSEEKAERASIAQLLKLKEAITIDFVSGVWIDPDDPIEAERRAFAWAIKDISETGIEFDVTFMQPLYISVGE